MDTLFHKLSFWWTADAHSEQKASDRPDACEPTKDQIQYAREIAEEERKAWMAHKRES